MIDPQDLWLTEEQVRAALSAKDGRKKSRRSKKTPKVDFLQFSVPLLLTLRKHKAPYFVHAMVWALSEAWFTTGLHGKHPNPFPVARVNTAKWKLSRYQKSRALRFLADLPLIEIDRTDTRKPLVTIFWAPRHSA